MSLDGKSIVLTGGSGALGSLIARNLMESGAEIVVIDRVAPDLSGQTFIEADISSTAGIGRAVAALAQHPVDMLINLAGIQYFGPFERQDDISIESGFFVNLLAPVRLSRAVLPGMLQRGSGHIVNVGSIFGSINFAHFVTYSSAKAGLRGFSEALRRELKGSDIAVTYVAPRAVKTGFNSEKVRAFAAATKMAMDSPADVARKICDSIRARRRDVYLGFPESVFVRVNAIAPRLVDFALAGNDRKARDLFAPMPA